MGVNPLGLPRPNPCPSVGNVPAKKPMTRHGHNFMPRPMPARVSGDPRVTHARQIVQGMGPCAQQEKQITGTILIILVHISTMFSNISKSQVKFKIVHYFTNYQFTMIHKEFKISHNNSTRVSYRQLKCPSAQQATSNSQQKRGVITTLTSLQVHYKSQLTNHSENQEYGHQLFPA
jgi:hypothetical protein